MSAARLPVSGTAFGQLCARAAHLHACGRRLVIMDEATSTLDLQNEALCMQRIVDEEIAMLTIAHRPSVVRYHQLMLTMETDGSFTRTPLIEMTPC